MAKQESRSWNRRAARRAPNAEGRGSKQNQNQKQDDWRVAELYIERKGNRSIVGNVYKGKVDNVLPGLEAAFVDIGLDKNGFLHADDIVFPGVEVARRGRGGRGQKGKRITELLKPGQEILVQAIKDPLKTKGPRLSMQLSIAGRYLVYVPAGRGRGSLAPARRQGARPRAARGGQGRPRRGRRDRPHRRAGRHARGLRARDQVPPQAPRRAAAARQGDRRRRRWSSRRRTCPCASRATSSRASSRRRSSTTRSSTTGSQSFFTRTAPELLERLEFYDDHDEPLFERYGVEEAIQSVLKRRVDLPSGGYLMIDYAEAMTVIDINSGSFTGRGKGAKLEDTITKTNLEAADEVVRQLRLRDIGGIIVIDFIDMSRARNRDAVLKTLRKALDEDRTKTYVVEISPLGLVEMTRQNVTDGVREILTKPCPTCEGEGVVLSEETVAIEVDRWLRDLVAERPESPAFLIRVQPEGGVDPGRRPRGGGPDPRDREGDGASHFHFEGTEALPIDFFEVVLEGTRDDVEERALPFREGEEVLVHIEEPHMYNEDDAVAKLDGYIVSVFGAAPLVGEKTLVRIEKVGRSRGPGLARQPARGRSRRAPTGRSRRTGAAGAGAAAAAAAAARKKAETASE